MAELKKRFPVYARLLRLYPPAYRAAYGTQMLQTLADMLDDSPGATRHAAIWCRLAVDFPASVAQQQIHYVGGIMAHETPRYIKRNALVGAVLLVPFMLALLANSLDTLTHGQQLYNSWLWRTPVLALWVLWLPLAAAVLTLLSLVTFMIQSRAQYQSGEKRGILADIGVSWPLLAVALAGLFVVAAVFGHDSVHCVTGNPVHELQSWHQTWHCIQQR